jgi:hypothetical protein
MLRQVNDADLLEMKNVAINDFKNDMQNAKRDAARQERKLYFKKKTYSLPSIE